MIRKRRRAQQVEEQKEKESLKDFPKNAR